MTKKLKDLFGDSIERYQDILDSILPGKENWEKFINNDGDCLPSCPFKEKCINKNKGQGPDEKLCTEYWQLAPANSVGIQVLKHIFKNYDYYDCGDYNGEIGSRVAELCTIFDIDDLEELNSSEAQRMVTVRLSQSEFRANLFNVWGGCSLESNNVANEYLIASHIKPWSKCDNKEDRVNGYNGFLLPANYDYVFDRFLITFGESGYIELINSKKLQILYSSLGINENAKINLRPENNKYLEYHRNIFDGKSRHLTELP